MLHMHEQCTSATGSTLELSLKNISLGTFFQQIFMKIIWSRVILPICVIHFPLGRIIRRERPRYAISCQGSSSAFTMPGHDDVPIPFPFPLLENTPRPRRIPRLENEKGVLRISAIFMIVIIIFFVV